MGKISFNRGYTKDGFADKVFHVHLRYAGDNDELYFRDYLNEHTQIAKEYERVKLWKMFEHNRDAYTDAKTEFVKKWTSDAKMLIQEDTDNFQLCARQRTINLTIMLLYKQ